MTSIPLSWWIFVATALFIIGFYIALTRKNAIAVLIGLELMLNATNINLVAFEAAIRSTFATGQIFAIFVITVAAAEVGIGLGIVLMIFRNRTSGNIDELDLMKW